MTMPVADPAGSPPPTLRPLSAVQRIPIAVQVVLGGATMSIRELATLERGAVVQLDSHVGDPVDILVNGRQIGRGEIVVLDEGDGRFAVSITELRDAPNAPGE